MKTKVLYEIITFIVLSALLLSRNASADGIVLGHISVNYELTDLCADSTMQDAVLLLGPPTFEGPNPGVVRMRAVENPDCPYQVRFQEWDYRERDFNDTWHTNEQVSYLGLSPDVYGMDDGSTWEVGTFTLSGTGYWQWVEFQSKPFADAPLLFLTMQSSNGGQAATVRAKEVGRYGFQAAIFEEEYLMDGHLQEDIGYLAIHHPAASSPGMVRGQASFSGTDYSYSLHRISANDAWTLVGGVRLKLEEEQSRDAEVGHVEEDIAVLQIADQAFAQQVSSNGNDTTALRRYPYNIYFGDLHVHTSPHHDRINFHQEFSEDEVENANLYARDTMNHDFVAVANHAWLLDDGMWETTKEVADEYTQEGEFISFPAYEWTASSACLRHYPDPKPLSYPQWGHRNVYFKNTAGLTPLLPCDNPSSDTPNELFSALPVTSRATTIPHHTSDGVHPFDWSTINANYDRVVEIVQNRSRRANNPLDFEVDIIENGWNNGQVLGVVGGTDNHNGISGGHTGITAILAPKLNRDTLFDALRNRQTYATTDGDIFLHFFGDGEMQGRVLSPRSQVKLAGDIQSVNGNAIAFVELLDNGIVFASWQPNQDAFKFERNVQVNQEFHYFHIRVTLENGNQAWSSPIWVNYPEN